MPAPAEPGARVPLFLDVDTGVDDALALLYACASPDAELVGVSCLPGNVALADVVRNTRAVLALAGRPDVPVAAGRETPLVRPLRISPDTHGDTGLGYAELPAPPAPDEPLPWAPAALAEAARRRPGELVLVTLGPLTNLALALELEPGLPGLLRRWVAMAGAYGVPGNTTPVAEWNVHCDPEAARAAVRAFGAAAEAGTAPRPLLLGLDVTEQVRMVPDDVVRLARLAGSVPDDTLDPRPAGAPEGRSVASNPVVRFVADALRRYFEFHVAWDGFYGAFVHDPVAVAAALDPGLVTTRAWRVDVDAAGGPADGQTVADRRGLLPGPPTCDVAVGVDAAAVLARWTERVARLAVARATVAR